MLGSRDLSDSLAKTFMFVILDSSHDLGTYVFYCALGLNKCFKIVCSKLSSLSCVKKSGFIKCEISLRMWTYN